MALIGKFVFMEEGYVAGILVSRMDACNNGNKCHGRYSWAQRIAVSR